MNPSSNLRAEDVIAWADACWGSPCACGARLVGTDAVLSLLLGYKSQPLCIPCLGEAHQEDSQALVHRSLAYMQRLDCYRLGWQYAQRRMAAESAAQPSSAPEAVPIPPEQVQQSDQAPTSQDTWDAGDMGCGDLVLELRVRLAELAPNEILKVRATDPGAPQDLPAWCRITQNPLVHSSHPHYWIQRRDPRAGTKP